MIENCLGNGDGNKKLQRSKDVAKGKYVDQQDMRMHSYEFDLIEVFPRNMGGDVVARQVIRSSTSVAANIAEGYGGRKGNEYISYLYQARRSLPETDNWLYLAS